MSFLIFDADDTLWENNIYFERAFDQFCDFLNHSKLAPGEVREVLNEIELVNLKIHGYGAINFGKNLQQAYRHLAERHVADGDLERIMTLAERILEQPIELIEGVKETLAELARRHHLTLFTKGHPEEQRLKVERSGLGQYFTHTAIVKEKNVEAYRRLADERSLDHSAAWMIGNSPKSDINPALEAGMNAVLVPHPHTWELEKQDVKPSPRLRQIARFSELTSLF